jgi:NADPH:quinone reductase-like Zn-dependent oxidoreductase
MSKMPGSSSSSETARIATAGRRSARHAISEPTSSLAACKFERRRRLERDTGIGMRAYELVDYSGLDSLTLLEKPSPRPGPRQVRVRIRATSLNYRDVLVASGKYSRGVSRRPLVPLSDGAGEVVEVGRDVTRLRVGDRIIGNFFQTWIDGPFDAAKGESALGGAIDGVLAEEVLFEEDAAVKIPDELSFDEASTLPCAGATAWVGLVERGKLAAGETVLAMGTGGVSIFALQIAKAFGARVLLTSSHDDKLARGKALGADETINYRTEPAWDERARALTGGRGVDHILEVGGEKTMPLSVRAVRDGGHISLVGLLSGGRGDATIAEKAGRGIRVDSVYVSSARDLAELTAFVVEKRIRPVVGRVFNFEQAKDAYRLMERGEHFGKIVIRA